MLSVEHADPSAELRPFLYGYVQRTSEPYKPAIVEPVVARAGSMLEFQFGDPFNVPAYGIDQPNLSDPITVVGPIGARRVRIIIQGRIEALTVLFRPFGFFALFGIPLGRFAGTGTEGGGVFGAPIRHLNEQLGNLSFFAQRVSALEAFLSHRLRKCRPLHPAHRALQSLTSMTAQRTLSNVSGEVGISTRQLERISLDYTGVTPKALARLARFQRALRLRQTTTQNWTWIAHAANYYDQMHMIREFRELAGDTPERAIRQISSDHLISFMTSPVANDRFKQQSRSGV